MSQTAPAPVPALCLVPPPPPARAPLRSGVRPSTPPRARAERVPPAAPAPVADPRSIATAEACVGCGRPRGGPPIADPRVPAEQTSAFWHCPRCLAPSFKTRAAKRILAEEIVRVADRGEGTLLGLAAEVAGHLAEQTVRRRARAVGVGVNPPAWSAYEGGPHRWFVAAGRLLLPFVETHRTWAELEAWAADQGWTTEDVRELVAWLAKKGDAAYVREAGPRLPPWDEKELGPDTRDGHPRWWVVATPDDDPEPAADATPAWAASLGPAALAGAGHAPRGGR